MRRLLSSAAVAGFAACAAIAIAPAPAFGQATDTFTASITLQTGLSVNCTNLNFGTITRIGSYAGGQTVTLPSSSDQTTVGTGLAQAGSPTRAACVVTGETGSNATAALSGASGTWNNVDTLQGVVLSRTVGGTETLTADLQLSKVTGIGNETIHVGGSLTIPVIGTAPDAAYTSADVTVTVTE